MPYQLADRLISSENGVVCPNENELPREQAVQDDFRIDYLESYADQIALKISEGIPIKSYLMWAWTVCVVAVYTPRSSADDSVFQDNFECE
jgi:beta-glucosidase/6-phospho-beta-glucosidase/beta-galactosidase